MTLVVAFSYSQTTVASPAASIAAPPSRAFSPLISGCGERTSGAEKLPPGGRTDASTKVALGSISDSGSLLSQARRTSPA